MDESEFDDKGKSGYYWTFLRYVESVRLLASDKGATWDELAAIVKKYRGTKEVRSDKAVERFIDVLKSVHGDWHLVGVGLKKVGTGKSATYHLTFPRNQAALAGGLMPVLLSAEELPILSFLLSINIPYLQGAFHEQKKRILEKVNLLSPDGRTYEALAKEAASSVTLSALGKVASNPELPFFSDPEILNDILVAIEQCQVCRVKYQKRSGEEPETFKFKPVRFFEKNGAPYILALKNDEGKLKSFRPAGILELEQMTEHFTDEKSDLRLSNDMINGFIDSAFTTYYGKRHDVRIEFDAKVAPFIEERKWVSNQSIVPLDHGGIELTFSASGDDDIIRWVLSWGAHATFHEPKELVKKYRKEVKNLVEKFLVDPGR